MPRTKGNRRHLQLSSARKLKKSKLDNEEPCLHLDSDAEPTPHDDGSRSRSRSSSVHSLISSRNSSSDEFSDRCDQDSDSSLDLVLDVNGEDVQSLDICKNPSLTRTEKKMILAMSKGGDDSDEEDRPTCSGRFVVEDDLIISLITSFPCRECLAIGKLTVDMKERWGLAVHLLVSCSECNNSFEWWSSKPEERNTPGKGRQRRAVNKATTLASLSCGMGATCLNNFCELLDLPGMHPKSFQGLAKTIYSSTDDILKYVFSNAADIVRSEHKKLNPFEEDNGSPLDIAVSYDGTWLTRGHTSKVGIGCVVEVLTGLVLDAHVMSTYCHICDAKSSLKEKDPKAFAEWEKEHLGSGACERNFNGEEHALFFFFVFVLHFSQT